MRTKPFSVAKREPLPIREGSKVWPPNISIASGNRSLWEQWANTCSCSSHAPSSWNWHGNPPAQGQQWLAALRLLQQPCLGSELWYPYETIYEEELSVPTTWLTDIIDIISNFLMDDIPFIVGYQFCWSCTKIFHFNPIQFCIQVIQCQGDAVSAAWRGAAGRSTFILGCRAALAPSRRAPCRSSQIEPMDQMVFGSGHRWNFHGFFMAFP